MVEEVIMESSKANFRVYHNNESYRFNIIKNGNITRCEDLSYAAFVHCIEEANRFIDFF